MHNTAAETIAQPATFPTRRNWLWWSLQILARMLFCVWFRFRAQGVEKLPKQGGALLLINHQSFLDPLLVGLPLSRPVSYLARDSLFRVPVVGWILRNAYVFPIDRERPGPSSLKQAVKRLNQGFLVGVFPEGTRSTDGRVGDLKPGFVALIRRSRLPVIPVGVAGSEEAMPRGAWFVRPRRCCVVFGDPISQDEFTGLHGQEQREALLRLARRRMIECYEEAGRARHNGGPQPAGGHVSAPSKLT